jgi:hypothetical protein
MATCFFVWQGAKIIYFPLLAPHLKYLRKLYPQKNTQPCLKIVPNQNLVQGK